MKLLIRGGSIAAGYGVIRSYADILKECLRPQKIDIINRSNYKETSFDGIGTFYKDIDYFEPDVLLIHFGVDDAFACVYRSEFQENLLQIIRLAHSRFHPLILLATSHTFDDPNEMDAVNIFNRSLRIVAADLGCELIPVDRYWAGYLEKHCLKSRDLVGADARYPNEQGHEVIAESILSWLSHHRKLVDGLGNDREIRMTS